MSLAGCSLHACCVMLKCSVGTREPQVSPWSIPAIPGLVPMQVCAVHHSRALFKLGWGCLKSKVYGEDSFCMLQSERAGHTNAYTASKDRKYHIIDMRLGSY